MVFYIGENINVEKKRCKKNKMKNMAENKEFKIYLISQSVNNEYDTYDSAVVIAESPEEAKKIHPNENYDYEEHKESNPYLEDKSRYEKADQDYGTWARKEFVKVEYLGIADKNKKKGVVCASFNAG